MLYLSSLHTMMEMAAMIFCLGGIVLSGQRMVNSGRTFRRLWYMLVYVIFLLAMDVLGFIFRQAGFYGAETVVHFLSYGVSCMQCFITWKYIANIQKMICRSDKIVWDRYVIIPFLFLLMNFFALSVNQWVPILYYFDEENQYCQLPLMWGYFAVLILALLFCWGNILQHRGRFTKRLYRTFQASIIIIVILSLLQIPWNGFALVNLAVFVVCFILFLEFWMDQYALTVQLTVEKAEEMKARSEESGREGL